MDYINNLRLMFPTMYIGIVRGFTSSHRGVDLGWNSNYGGQNVPLYAPADGTVVAIIDNMGNTYYTGVSTWGNYVKINHGNSVYTLCAHMLKGSITKAGIKVGTKVSRGQQIGNMNNSGYSNGSHLHYEVYLGGSGTGYRVDPLIYTYVYSKTQIVGGSTESAWGNRLLRYDGTSPSPSPTPSPSTTIGIPVSRDVNKNQIEILSPVVNGRIYPGTDSRSYGYVTTGIYNISYVDGAKGPVNKNGYNWYCISPDINGIGDRLWVAYDSSWAKLFLKESDNPPVAPPIVDNTIEKMIDISTWQSIFNPVAAKQNGISTVICRCGYGDSTKDNRWDVFSKAVINSGLKLGTYGFSTWHYDSVSGGNISTARLKMKEQIDHWISIIGDTEIKSWFALDMELELGQSCSFNKSDLTTLVNEACAYIESKGFKACVYASASWFDSSNPVNIRLNTDELKYPIWIAWYYWRNHPDYNDKSTSGFANNGQLPPSDFWCQKYSDKICAWQFGSQGFGNKYGVGSDGLDKNWLYFQPKINDNTPEISEPEPTFDIGIDDLPLLQKNAVVKQLDLLGIKYTVN